MMFEELIFEKLWIILSTWLVLYLSDYYLTILGARYHKAGARDHFIFEGSYELTPEFQSDIDALRMFSPKFLGRVIISSALIVFLWYVSSEGPTWVFVFRFLCGGLILQEVAIHVRHAHNLALFRLAKNHQGISGQIRYEKWFSYRMSAVELLSFAVVFLIAYLFTGSVSFLGGSVITAITGLKHSKMSRKAPEEHGGEPGGGDSTKGTALTETPRQ